MDPVEAEMFDKDAAGNCQVALLAHETLHIPLTFLSLVPYTPLEDTKSSKIKRKSERTGNYDSKSDSKYGENKYDEKNNDDDNDTFEPESQRVIDIRVISGSHGHVVAVLKVHICPRPYVVDRCIRFYEPENSIMKRRIQLTGYNQLTLFPGETAASMKYIHCVETTTDNIDSEGGGNSKVLVEWGASQSGQQEALDMIIRYRCSSFPHVGSFYILLYNDPYQSSLHEVISTFILTIIL
jgi:hypothetical protein